MTKSIIILGMPGAGKSTIGRELAVKRGLPFVDSDIEVEKAANMSISQIFEELGEAAFRDGERKIISRLLTGTKKVLSTGGGSFMDESTREIIKKEAISIWLKVEFEVLLERVLRSKNRPLLNKEDPETVLRNLIKQREPIFAQADIIVETTACPVHETVEKVIRSLDNYS